MSGHADHADVKIHPPVLLLFHLIAAFFFKWMTPLNIPAPQGVKVIGLVVLIAGFLFALGGVAELNRTRTTLSPHGTVSVMVSSGVYRFSRNPIYTGYFCTLIGLPLSLGNYWGLIISPALIYFFNELIIKHEEVYLQKKFGDVYTGYRSRVRRWL
jgi:protein-S-isoprenylcysteine O-methyltransferase Ste14